MAVPALVQCCCLTEVGARGIACWGEEGGVGMGEVFGAPSPLTVCSDRSILWVLADVQGLPGTNGWALVRDWSVVVGGASISSGVAANSCNSGSTSSSSVPLCCSLGAPAGGGVDAGAGWAVSAGYLLLAVPPSKLKYCPSVTGRGGMDGGVASPARRVGDSSSSAGSQSKMLSIPRMASAASLFIGPGSPSWSMRAVGGAVPSLGLDLLVVAVSVESWASGKLDVSIMGGGPNAPLSWVNWMGGGGTAALAPALSCRSSGVEV